MFKSCFLLMFSSIVTILVPIEGQDALFFRGDYQLDNGLNKFFKFHNYPLNFSSAVATCKAEGAELFTPTSLNETETVYRLLNGSDTILWIGIHDLFNEGTFVNLKGERDFYSNWRAGEPNDSLENEDCVGVFGDYTFNDVACHYRYKFVCTRSTANLTRNEQCDTYDLDYIYNATLRKCYKVHKEPQTWGEAYRTCLSEESNLAIVNSELEAQHLVELMEMYPETSLRGNFDKLNFLLGFNDLINHGSFLTVEGKTLSESGYDDWNPGQPDNYMEEHCGSMFRNGKLNDVGCYKRAMFFCEKDLPKLALDIRNPFPASKTIKTPDAKKIKQ